MGSEPQDRPRARRGGRRQRVRVHRRFAGIPGPDVHRAECGVRLRRREHGGHAAGMRPSAVEGVGTRGDADAPRVVAKFNRRSKDEPARVGPRREHIGDLTGPRAEQDRGRGCGCGGEGARQGPVRGFTPGPGR